MGLKKVYIMGKQQPVMEKKYEQYYELASESSYRNSRSVLDSSRCGCYFCRKIFPPDEIRSFIDYASTAMCPYCGIDSVIGDASGIPIREDVLEELHERWFGRDEDPQRVCAVSEDCGTLPSLLDYFEVESRPQGQFDTEQPEVLPDCYCYRDTGADNRRMASWFKSHGVPVIWFPLPPPADDDCGCAGLSDVIVLTGGDPTDTRLSEKAPSALVVRTLGRHGLLYRLRGGAWNHLRPVEDLGCDFNNAADHIVASIVSSLSLVGKAPEDLQEEDAERILAEAMEYVIAIHSNPPRVRVR